MLKGTYKTITIEAAQGGWVVKERGKPAEVFVRWDALVRRLELELTSKGDNDAKQGIDPC